MKYRFQILDKRLCYKGFFRLESYRLRHQLFAGGWSKVIDRELFARGHAAALMPYDPKLDSVCMIEQFRIGALAHSGGPWLLEFIAGIIEEGESPEQVARREAMEEGGLEITQLLPVSDFSLSPGGCSERIHLFCGRVDAGNAGGIERGQEVGAAAEMGELHGAKGSRPRRAGQAGTRGSADWSDPRVPGARSAVILAPCR